MDFKAIADAVKAIGFAGVLSLEQDGSGEDMKETCRRYIRRSTSPEGVASLSESCPQKAEGRRHRAETSCSSF
jgi:hypothetical protein